MNKTDSSMANVGRALSEAEVTLHRLLGTRERVGPAEREILSRCIAELQDEIADLRADLVDGGPQVERSVSEGV